MENKYSKYSCILYNETKPPGTSVDGDLEFYKNLLLPVEGYILEAGVGNGRLLIPLLRYKLNVIGVDKSLEMIEICKQNMNMAGLNASIIHTTLENYVENNFFEFIIMPNASFCLLENREKANIVLKNFYNSLKSGGTLAIDLIFPIDFKAGTKHSMEHKLNNDHVVVENYSKEINWYEQYTINEIKYYVDQNLCETQLMKLRWYGVKEFEEMLSNIGFTDIEVIKNYNNKRILNLKTITIIGKK